MLALPSLEDQDGLVTTEVLCFLSPVFKLLISCLGKRPDTMSNLILGNGDFH